MMTFKPGYQDTFVWIWLPGEAEPVVCGRVAATENIPEAVHRFIYGRSYRQLDNAIPLIPHTLPLRAGEQPSRRGLHGVLRDAAPDTWGRRVLMYRCTPSAPYGSIRLI